MGVISVCKVTGLIRLFKKGEERRFGIEERRFGLEFELGDILCFGRIVEEGLIKDRSS